MNLTAELVAQWATYEETHAGCSIEDFCRFYLTKEREKEKQFLGGIVPPKDDQTLAKLCDRITRLYLIYAEAALRRVGLKSFDDFLYINVVGHLDLPKKTEVIATNFSELSSGLLIIARLLKNGYVTEYQDEADKRSKRLLLTDKGKSILKGCYEELKAVNYLFYNDMPSEDIKLCIQLLSPLELKFSGLLKQHRAEHFKIINRKNT